MSPIAVGRKKDPALDMHSCPIRPTYMYLQVSCLELELHEVGIRAYTYLLYKVDTPIQKPPRSSSINSDVCIAEYYYYCWLLKLGLSTYSDTLFHIKHYMP